MRVGSHVRLANSDMFFSKIQAWWRGRNAGSAVKAMLAMRRKKQARLYIQTKKDDQTRKTLKYRLKKMAGVADTLKTDVTYERDMRGVALVSRPPKVCEVPSHREEERA